MFELRKPERTTTVGGCTGCCSSKALKEEDNRTQHHASFFYGDAVEKEGGQSELTLCPPSPSSNLLKEEDLQGRTSSSTCFATSLVCNILHLC
jgi:hypothetical protein